MSWSSPHTPLEVIPQSQLFSGSAPAAPTNLQVADISGTQTNLTWTTNSTDEDGYEVDRMLGSSGTFSAVAFLPPASNQYLDTGLTPGNTYTYEVRALNFVADSAWSNQAAVTMAVLPDAISSAMPTTVATNSIAMAWTNNDDNGTEIRIFRLSGLGGNPVFITTLTFSTATDPADEPSSYVNTGPGGLGLIPGAMYGYEVECGNIAGFSAASSFSVQTLTNAPGQLLAVPANGQVTLSWIAPFGAQTFNIYRGTTSGGENAAPLATGVIGTSFVNSTVTNGTQYYYEVTAVNTGGESARSAESSAIPQTPTALALAPTKLSATPGDKTILLAWQAAPGASSYNVYRGTASGGEVLVASNVPGPQDSDGGLTDGVTYYYEVTSVNQAGESLPSSEVSATPQVTAPPTPINVTATAGNNQVSLSWSPASDALTYDLYRSTVEGNEVVYEQGITGTSFTDTNTTDGVTYYYQVSAGNGVGESNLSQEVSATPLPALPAAPAHLTATTLSSSQISLTWTEPAGTATSFTLERSVNGVNFTPLTMLDGTAVSFVDAAGLDPTTTYDYRLSATNLAGNSAWSSVVSAEPLTAVSSPWTDADIGSPPLAGSAYELDGTVYVNGTGSDIWNASDQFHYVYVPLNGNGTIIAQVTTQGQTDPSAKAGVMIRNTLAANSAFADMVLTPGNGAAFQYRVAAGNNAGPSSGSTTGGNTYFAPDWVELVRSGSTFTGYVSTNGTSWTKVGSSTTLTMNTSVYIGLCVSSHNTGLISEATFDEISINGGTTPVAPSNLTATAASGTSVSLSWTNNDNLSFANEVYRQNPGSSTFTWIATVPANATAYLDTGLTPGASYSYQVLASNTVGNTASNTATVTTPVPPLAVSALQPGSVTTTSALLSWALNSSNDTGVQVWRRSGGAGSFSLATTLAAGSTSYVNNSLQPGTLYEYHVLAIDLAGSSPAADTGLTTLPLAPVVTAATQGGQVQLSWTASNGAVSYNIYRGLAPGGENAAALRHRQQCHRFHRRWRRQWANLLLPRHGRRFQRRKRTFDRSRRECIQRRDRSSFGVVCRRRPRHLHDLLHRSRLYQQHTQSGRHHAERDRHASGTVGVSGTGATRIVTISNITGNGSLGISVAAGTASNSLGKLAGAAGPSATFTVDNIAPTISIGTPSASFTAGTPVTYTVTYADANFNSSTLAAANITLNETGTASGTIGVSGSGLTRTVTVSNITGNGSLGISIAAGTASDLAGNLAPAAGPSTTFAVDNTAPTVATPASAAPSLVTGTTTALSVLGADSLAGESSLTYSWAATLVPSGAGVPLFSINGSNAAKNTTATFTAAGNYTFQVTITNDSGQTATSSVNVTVNQTLNTLGAISPNPVVLSTQSQEQFTVTGLDQFGNAMAAPGVTWTAAKGTITSSGLYTSPAAAGSDTIAAQLGSSQVTASATIVAPVGWWQFNEGTGTTAYDSSANADNGTISGAASAARRPTALPTALPPCSSTAAAVW